MLGSSHGHCSLLGYIGWFWCSSRSRGGSLTKVCIGNVIARGYGVRNDSGKAISNTFSIFDAETGIGEYTQVRGREVHRSLLFGIDQNLRLL